MSKFKEAVITVAKNSDSSSKKIFDELLKELENLIHKRLIQAYRGEDPLKSMESELGKILLEILNRED
jgi:hypothetical protein